VTHIRQFLADAAPEPSVAVDAAALVRQARRRVWRRGMAWGAGLVAVVVGAGGGWAQLAPAGDTAPDAALVRLPVDHEPRVEPVDANESGATAGAAGASAATRPGGSTASTSDGAGGTSAAAGVGRAPAEPVAGSGATELTVAEEVAPTGEGCAVRNGERCSYVAEHAGGYRGYGVYEIDIERNGQTTRYVTPPEDQAKPYPCRDVGFIQPGDRVTVSIPENPPTTQATVRGPVTGKPSPTPPPPPSEVQVGPDAHC
jgi:hypothetical protein